MATTVETNQNAPMKDGADLPDAMEVLPGKPKSILNTFRSLYTFLYGNLRKAAAQGIMEYGPVTKGSTLGMPTVGIADPEVAEYLLRQEGKLIELENPKSIEMMVGKNAIVSTHGELHTNLRKLFSTVFEPNSMEKLCPVVSNAVASSLDKLLDMGETKDIAHELRNLTLDVSCRVVLGTAGVTIEELDSVREDLKAYGQAFFTIPMNLPGTTYSAGLKARKRLRAFMETRIEHEKKRLEEVEVGLSDERSYKSILELLLVTMENDTWTDITDEVLRDNVVMLLFAAMDTTASTVTGLILALCARTDVMQKVREEQQQIVSKFGSEYTPKVVSEMKYLYAVVWEYLQVNAPVAGTFRRAIVDFELPGYNVKVKKGQMINIGYASVHFAHDPSIGTLEFPELVKEQFNPDKMYKLFEEGKPAGKAWMPFGLGKRYCIGAPLAKMVVHVLFAELARKVDFKLLSHLDRLPEMGNIPMPRPKEKVAVQFQPRS